jgi:PilZ domain-containing protein
VGVFPLRLRRADFRRAPRHELHFPAYIMVDNETHQRPCMIHDVSESGARLTIGLRTEIPDTFTLVFARHCRVVRRVEGESQIAVEFLPAKFLT